MSYFDVRTGHALLGYAPAFGRYTLGATVDYNIDAIAAALLDKIGQIKLDFGFVGLGSLKLEELVPDEIESALNAALSSALSRYVQRQLDLSKDATANNVADAISSDFISKIRPKLMGYVGLDNSSNEFLLIMFNTLMDVGRVSLKSSIKSVLTKVGKAAGAKENQFAIDSTNPYGGAKSSFPIVPVAIGAAALLAVILLVR